MSVKGLLDKLDRDLEDEVAQARMAVSKELERLGVKIMEEDVLSALLIKWAEAYAKWKVFLKAYPR